MKKHISLFIGVLFLIGLIGCSGVQVTSTQTIEKKIVKLASIAAVLFAANNGAEVAAVLPYVRTAFAMAKDGKLEQSDISALISTLSNKTDNRDVRTALTLLAVEISGIEITGNGTVNSEIVEALEMIVSILETVPITIKADPPTNTFSYN